MISSVIYKDNFTVVRMRQITYRLANITCRNKNQDFELTLHDSVFSHLKLGDEIELVITTQKMPSDYIWVNSLDISDMLINDDKIFVILSNKEKFIINKEDAEKLEVCHTVDIFIRKLDKTLIDINTSQNVTTINSKPVANIDLQHTKSTELNHTDIIEKRMGYRTNYCNIDGKLTYYPDYSKGIPNKVPEFCEKNKKDRIY